ncbi:MAG: hypothetical protein GY820_22580, partial [Gammaproteobacteria bacterium]|nr:hypothetical protein [Gammaproteobacteria bacterium]
MNILNAKCMDMYLRKDKLKLSIAFLLVLLIVLSPNVFSDSSPASLAKTYYQKAYQIDQQYPDGPELEMLEKSIDDLKKAVELDTELLDAYLLLGRFYNQKAVIWEKDRSKKAVLENLTVQQYRKAAQLAPNNPEVAMQLLVFLENETEAQRLLESVLQSHPNFAPGHLGYANSLKYKGEINHAIAEYQKYISLQLENNEYVRTSVYITLWELFTAQDRKDEAVELLNQYIESDRVHVVASTLSQRVDLSQYTESKYRDFIDKVGKIINHKDKKNIVEAYRLLEEGRLAMAMEKFNKQISVNPYATRHYREF